MNNRKSLLMRLVETYEQYRTEKRNSSLSKLSSSSRSFPTLLRWLIPNGGTLLIVILLLFTQNIWAAPLLAPVGAPGPSATTVNYQGRLADSGGNPLSGTYGMQFAIYDTDSGGNLIWGPESHSAVPVNEGLFSVGLGSQTAGGIPTTTWDGDRYLEITVNGETLNPRELIRSVPIAGMALTVPNGAIGAAQLADGSVSETKLAPGAVTEIEVLRQDNTTNSSDDRVILTGWGYIQGNGTPGLEESVNFGLTFSEPPVVVANYLGVSLSASGIDDFSIVSDPSTRKVFTVIPLNISTSGFQLLIRRNEGDSYSDRYYGYSWVAIGKKAP